jgi:ribosomal protein S17
VLSVWTQNSRVTYPSVWTFGSQCLDVTYPSVWIFGSQCLDVTYLSVWSQKQACVISQQRTCSHKYITRYTICTCLINMHRKAMQTKEPQAVNIVSGCCHLSKTSTQKRLTHTHTRARKHTQAQTYARASTNTPTHAHAHAHTTRTQYAPKPYDPSMQRL